MLIYTEHIQNLRFHALKQELFKIKVKLNTVIYLMTVSHLFIMLL